MWAEPSSIRKLFPFKCQDGIKENEKVSHCIESDDVSTERAAITAIYRRYINKKKKI